MVRWSRLGVALAAFAIACSLSVALAPAAEAHQSGCHRWHTCPSDSGSYVCGDLGYSCQTGTTPAPTPTPAPAPTPTPAPAPPPPPIDDRDCADFANQDAAQDYFNAHPGDPSRLDADGNGIACEDLGAATPPPERPEKLRARIVSVIDGDTVKVRTSGGKRLTVRLIGIDTPETRKPGTRIECGGRDATTNMKRYAFRRDGRGHAVRLTTDPSQDRTDRYGRLLAYVDVAGGRDLALQQIRSGYSDAYVYEAPFARLDRYRSAATRAQSTRTGVWDKCGGDFHTAARPR